MKIIDVGAGLGGSAFHMAKLYNPSEIIGIDLSINMIEIANEKNNKYKYNNVTFEVADCTLRSFPENSYDFIYSRDTILHIQDKLTLFKNFYKWLKPGGKLFITDYCSGEKNLWNDEFTKYVASRGYDLHTPKNYGKIIENAGFINVQANDETNYWRSLLNNELDKCSEGHEVRKEILTEFTEQDLNALMDGWRAKVKRVDAGYQKWGAFYAMKPE